MTSSRLIIFAYINWLGKLWKWSQINNMRVCYGTGMMNLISLVDSYIRLMQHAGIVNGLSYTERLLISVKLHIYFNWWKWYPNSLTTKLSFNSHILSKGTPGVRLAQVLPCLADLMPTSSRTSQEAYTKYTLLCLKNRCSVSVQHWHQIVNFDDTPPPLHQNINIGIFPTLI